MLVKGEQNVHELSAWGVKIDKHYVKAMLPYYNEIAVKLGILGYGSRV